MAIRKKSNQIARRSRSAWMVTRLEDRVTPANQLLPDFQILPSAYQVSTDVLPYMPGQVGGNYRYLEFATALANYGQGPFELRGTTTIVTEPDGTQSQLANQRIYYDDGTFQDRPAGYMVYHPTHSHVHFEDMAWGLLRQRTAGDGLGAVVAVGPKTSFCLIDIQHSQPALPGSPASSKYNSCGTSVQGISVGWNDVYDIGLDGQWIDITGVPNGDYWLEIVADVADHITETNETNNVTRIPITLTGLPTVLGFRVTESTPLGGNFNPVDHVDFSFNQDVDATTFTVADVAMSGPNGAITPTSVTQLASNQFRVAFPTQTETGTYITTVGPNISSIGGSLLDQNNNGAKGEAADKYSNIFTITPPRLNSITPVGEAVPPVSSVRVTYNMVMNSSSFTTADIVSFTGPGGTNLLSSITGIVPVTSGGQSQAFDITFNPASLSGTYTMVVGAGIQDLNGRYVDQNLNGNENEAADATTVTFNISAPHINTVTPAGQAAPPVSSVRVTYNSIMNSSTFDLSDIVAFTGPTGNDLLGSITSITPVTVGGQSQAFDINFAAQSTPGLHTLTIGGSVQDIAGRFVDQNGDGLNNASDQYIHTFVIQIPGTYGPDSFGYKAADFAYQTVSMTGATALTITGNTDDGYSAINLGTNTFTFYDQTYLGSNALYASTNGLLTFGSSNTAYDNAAGLASITQPAIAVLWDDWKASTGNPQMRSLLRDSDGVNGIDQLVIEWNNIRHYDNSGDITFQVILELNTGARPGRITFNYADLLTTASGPNSNGATATVGIRSGGALNSTLVVAQNQSGHPLLGSGEAMQLSVPYVKSITRVDPNPAPDGDAEFLVTFSEPMITIDALDFALVTSGTIKGASVDHIHSTADPAVFEVHCLSGTGSGNLRLDLIDNETIISQLGAKLGGAGLVNGDFKSGETYTIVQQPAKVDALFVGDGTSQRSMVNQVRVDFTKTVTFSGTTESAFQLTGPSGAVTLYVDTSLSDASQTRAILRFSPIGQPLVTLPDGKYSLTILGSNISTGGVNFDGDNNGSAGGDFVTQFHRLFGDQNGDGQISAVDFNAFRAYYGTNSPGNMFDSDGDNLITAADFNAFRMNYGLVLIP